GGGHQAGALPVFPRQGGAGGRAGRTRLRDTAGPPASGDPGRRPARSRVRDAVGAYFAVIDEHPNLYWLLGRHSKARAESRQDSMARDRETIATTLTAVIGDYLRVYGLDSGGAEPWAYGMTGLVQSTGEWWLQRRSMNRAHVVEYVTQMIWAAIAGMLRAAG